jgi:inhibitor of cysteine peptidase
MFVGLLVFVSGCGGSETTTEVLQADAAKGVNIAVGEQFDLVLESNETTGFTWQMVEPTDEQVVKKISEEYIESNTGQVGAGGTDHWTFEGAHSGETTIKMEYVRPWEPKASPDKTVELKVTVTE